MMSSVQSSEIKRTIKNKFAKACCVCKQRVEEQEGFACESENGWSTYCRDHVPVKIGSVRAEVTAKGEVYFPFSTASVSLIRSLHGARWHKEDKFWSVSTEPEHLPRLVEVAERIGLRIAPELVIRAGEVQVRQVEAISGKVDTKSLFPFQVVGAAFLQSHKRCLLGDEMGTGKTVQTLAALPENAAVLVVCPASLKFNWRDECQKWRPDFKVSVLSGRGSFRFPMSGELIICNYDILPKSFEGSPEFVLVCDEVHMCKNYKTNRTKAVKQLAKIAKKTVGLTGTPLMNRPFDLFGVLSALHLEKEVFGNWDGFLRAFNGSKDRWGGYQFGRVADYVPELMRRVMLRRRREEVLPELPKKSYTTIQVDNLSAKLKKQMDALYQDVECLLETEQLPPFEMFSGLRAELAKSRIPDMLELVENHEEEGIPLVVFSAHRSPIDELEKRDGWAVITGDTKADKRQEIVRQFQAGNLKGVGLTITAGGVGLTLTHAWKAIFVDMDWTPALNAQAEDRICRIGQVKPCEIVRMVSNHVLDQHIQNLIASKMALFTAAIDYKVEAVKIIDTLGETDEEFAARMLAVQATLDAQEEAKHNAEKQAVESRVKRIIEREAARCGGNVKFPEFTDELFNKIVKGMESMLTVCDGAKERDKVGFNKPDALVSRYLYQLGFDNQYAVQAAYLMLKRYPKQVSL